MVRASRVREDALDGQSQILRISHPEEFRRIAEEVDEGMQSRDGHRSPRRRVLEHFRWDCDLRQRTLLVRYHAERREGQVGQHLVLRYPR